MDLAQSELKSAVEQYPDLETKVRNSRKELEEIGTQLSRIRREASPPPEERAGILEHLRKRIKGTRRLMKRTSKLYLIVIEHLEEIEAEVVSDKRTNLNIETNANCSGNISLLAPYGRGLSHF